MSDGPVYRRAGVSDYFGALADREWSRLESTVDGRVKYAIHRKFLDEYVVAGMRVVDVGCGPGRFAIDAIKAGARVTLVDISAIQLTLANAKIAERGLSEAVDGSHALDILDLRPLQDAGFDAVICYGGAVSYVREHHVAAIAELVRITRPGGVLLISVMSLLGTVRLIGPLDAEHFLTTMGRHLPWDGRTPAPEVMLTQPGSDEFHMPMALFTAAYLRAVLEAAGCDVLKMAASNPVTSAGLPLDRISANPDAEALLSQLELGMCEEPGLVDSGTHLLAVARRRADWCG